MSPPESGPRRPLPLWLWIWLALVTGVGGLTESVHGGAPWFAALGTVPEGIQALRVLNLAEGSQWPLAQAILARNPGLQVGDMSIDPDLAFALASNADTTAREAGLQLASHGTDASGARDFRLGNRLFELGQMRDDDGLQQAGFNLVLAAAQTGQQEAIDWIAAHRKAARSR